MNPDYAELRRLAKEAAEECGPESDWFDPDLIESGQPVNSSLKARRFTAAMTPHMAMRLLRLADRFSEDLPHAIGGSAVLPAGTGTPVKCSKCGGLRHGPECERD
jgi:hypothetical protein